MQSGSNIEAEKLIINFTAEWYRNAFLYVCPTEKKKREK